MSFTIHAINIAPGRSYRTLERLHDATLHDAARELIRWSIKRSGAVVMRDCRGQRYSVSDAMELHGLTSVEKWHQNQWLAKQPSTKEPV